MPAVAIRRRMPLDAASAVVFPALWVAQVPTPYGLCGRRPLPFAVMVFADPKIERIATYDRGSVVAVTNAPEEKTARQKSDA